MVVFGTYGLKDAVSDGGAITRLSRSVLLCRIVLAASVVTAMGALPVHAAVPVVLPGAADAARIDARENKMTIAPDLSAPSAPADLFSAPQAPEATKNYRLTLRDVRIEGLTAFSPAEVKDISAPYLGHEVSLDVLWLIAGQLTERYHSAGYFLSRVVVPQQEINDGVVTLRVIEGYIGEVKFDDELAQNRIVRRWLAKLQSYRPLKADQVESVLLQLNDLPGVDLRAVLEPLDTKGDNDGAIRLVLERKPVAPVAGMFNVDNYGSRFLGPYEMQAMAQAVVLPTQRTTFSVLSSLDINKLKFGSVRHELPLFEGATLELYVAYTKAKPGYTLKPEEIISHSITMGSAVDYTLLRQRQETLVSRVAFETRRTDTDMLGAALTRDNIKAARLGLNYQTMDAWAGRNMIDAVLSQGLNIMGASQPGDDNLSRANARPDFTKINMNASRLQSLGDSWAVFASGAAQLSSGPLYSSEQFGYGGQAFGRAYDDSEITGDRGVAGSVELRYQGINVWHGLQPMPYQFYDMGAVWNQDTGQYKYATGSSAGIGLKMLSDFGFSSNFGLAFPLTRRASDPVSGNGKNPRYFLQISYGF